MEDNNRNVNLTNQYEARLKEENEQKRQARETRYVKVSETPPMNGRPGGNGKPAEKKMGLVPILIIGAILMSMLSEAGLTPLIPLGIIGFVAFKIGKKILADRSEYTENVYRSKYDHKNAEVKKEEVKPEPVKKEKVKKAEVKKEEKFTTGDPEIDKLIDDKEKAVLEMRRLNAAIEDPVISEQIDHLEEVTTKILNHIVQNPSKKSQVNRFFNYYLPTTLKLLNAYDRMDDAGISGTNIDGTKGKVEEMMKTAMAAFDKQLDALFAEDALDVATDITVMENLLKSEGLTDDNMTLNV